MTPNCIQATETKYQPVEAYDGLLSRAAQNIKWTLLRTNLDDDLEKNVLKCALHTALEGYKKSNFLFWLYGLELKFLT